MRTLEKGLTNHHTKCCTICMQKSDGTMATIDNKNAKVFCQHFDKIFNNQSPLPCDETALDLINNCPDFTHLEDAPSLTDVRTALHWMANGKAPDPS
eukprot:11557300-Ditylum_brightwellii.AAC.1